MILILPSQALVLNAYAVLVGAKPGNAALKEHQAFINTPGVGVAGYKAALESFASGNSTTATLATALLNNLGLSAVFTQAQAEAFLAANPGNRVGVMMDLGGQLYSYTGTQATLLAAKAAYVAKITDSYNYSNNTANVIGQEFPGTGPQTYTLTTSLDNFVGTAGGDSFLARTVNGANTFQDGDMLDGGAGSDVVYLDFATVGNAATPNLRNIESVVVRAQSASTDANGVDANDGNNMQQSRTVQIDAQRSLATDLANKVVADIGVTNWESSNSRSDVIIEDVRIGNAQKTKDITITFRESDPGNVDYGVYFDQHSLRNSSSGNTTLNIKLMDTGAAATPATAATPLLNNPYDLFKLAINGVLTSLQLDKVAVAAADTYPALLAVFNTALTGTGITAVLADPFTITDPLSNTQVTGQSIILTAGGGIAITAPAGSGWFNTTGASVPASSNIYTTFTSGATNVTELVTSTIVLDDVGRGSTGGDLVVGGMSVGDTSTSRGVERFEITVQDSSKLQTINSTNNALREVTIVNGTTSNNTSAYNIVTPNAGDLTVNGRHPNGDAVLPGVETGSPVGVHDNTGFTDVRIIDGSAMTGKFAFTAAVTTDSLAKYVNLVDTQPVPTADVAGAGNTNFNVRGANFAYSGGANNDTMVVTVDSDVLASTTLTGQSDFTIALNGGAGNDSITLNIGGQKTVAWYADQVQNRNVTIDAGAGNDTIRTPGAGNVTVTAGEGNDVVYADNSGIAGAKWTVNAVTPTNLADIQTAGAGVSGFLYKGVLTVTISGPMGNGGVVSPAAAAQTNGFEVAVNIPTGANFMVTELHLNQAIKDAINNNSVLKQLLLAEDGPGNTLIVKSLVDGAFTATDLQMNVRSSYVAGAIAGEDATVLAAFIAATSNSAATQVAASTAIAATVTAANLVSGLSVPALAATGIASTATTDDTINLGAGDDVAVLSTSALANDTLVLTGYAQGTNTIVNFDDATSSRDALDFSSYLTGKASATGTTDSAKNIAITANTDAIVEANSVTSLRATFTVDTLTTKGDSFAGLTESVFLAAINSTNTVGGNNYAGLTDGTFNALNTYSTTGINTGLVGGVGTAVVMIENNLNLGQYKAFELTFTGATTNTKADFSAAREIAVLDFGNTVGGLNGANLANIVKSAAGAAPVPGGTTPTFTLAAAAASVNEGANLVFNLTTTNVADGTVIAYAITGTTVTVADSGIALTGSVTVVGNSATVTVAPTADVTTEGAETLTLSIAGSTASVVINDTSLTGAGPVARATAITDGGSQTETAAFNTLYTAPSTNAKYTINGFQANDKIDFAAAAVPTVINDSFTDGNIVLQWASAGVVVEVTVTGIAIANEITLTGIAGWDVVFGAGTII